MSLQETKLPDIPEQKHGDGCLVNEKAVLSIFVCLTFWCSVHFFFKVPKLPDLFFPDIKDSRPFLSRHQSVQTCGSEKKHHIGPDTITRPPAFLKHWQQFLCLFLKVSPLLKFKVSHHREEEDGW